MQTNSNESNVWRIVVIVALCMLVGLAFWVFFNRASADMQAFFVAAAVWLPIGVGVGMLMGRGSVGATRIRAEEHEDAFESGYHAGIQKGYQYALEDNGCTVVVPTQQRELVPVRR